ncbi:MAG: EFR1 family ferrodoxin [bacterium]
MNKTSCIALFSQTGNTSKVAEVINREFDKGGWSSRILSVPEDDPSALQDASVLGVGTPVMYMEVPPVVKRWIKSVPQGKGRPSFVFTTYGHVYGGNVLRKLAAILTQAGYTSAGGIEVPAEHNFPTLKGAQGFGPGKPDQEMLANVESFARGLVERLEKDPNLSVPLSRLDNGRKVFNFVSGLLSLQTKINSMPEIKHEPEKCEGCGACADVCPQENIRIENGKAVRGDDCIKCWQCVENCPENALTVNYQKGERMIRLSQKMAMVRDYRVMKAE